MANAIDVEGVAKSFGDVVALDGVEFEVATGTVFGLLGPNGAGKTTMVRVLATILEPDRGRAEVLGLDVSQQAREVRPLIGLAGQNAAVDANLTGMENLRLIGRLSHLGSKVIKERSGELLERFGLSDAADRTVRTYSGGMRRRLDLAAALVHRPPVLFLDEPTTGLDIQGRSELWDMIRELVAANTTVLLTTQYLEEADRLADRVAVIHGGKVIANDTPAALKARLGGTVTELNFHDQDTAIRARERLARQLDMVEREGTLVRLTLSDGSRQLMNVLRTLDSGGLEPASLTVRDPSLDDVFLALTGRHTEAPPNANISEVSA
ncbi:MAG: ATP-binding cassette domain-containing protein [Actinobacteria bacterium]|nr:ATP-binding cassette domain-containing protein [Actinomycetota bacterium]